MIDDLKGDESWRMFRIISEFTEGFDRLSSLDYAISIFGSARLPPDNPHYQKTVELAKALGEKGFGIITGGGPGIMEAANKGALEQGVPSVGLNIRLPQEQAPNQYQNLSLEYRYFFARKVMFVKHSMGYICMPGGFGTMDEFFEALTLMQTVKIYSMPMVLFGVEYWQGLLDWMRASMLPEGAISESDFDYITLTDDIELTVSIMEKHRIFKRKMREKPGE
ncbi:MAG: TIGR00730 family Rossman fold protein [Gammaproteobacteria bacterium]|nr:TIGR00730 family Rossman fold protein [Gammaproteobacteria bacterium]